METSQRKIANLSPEPGTEGSVQKTAENATSQDGIVSKLNYRPDALKMLTISARSILDLLRMKLSNYIQVSDRDVICRTETWLTHDVPVSALGLTCFDVHRQDRKCIGNRTSSHGGLLTAINNEIQYERLDIDLHSGNIVALSIQMDRNLRVFKSDVFLSRRFSLTQRYLARIWCKPSFRLSMRREEVIITREKGQCL